MKTIFFCIVLKDLKRLHFETSLNFCFSTFKILSIQNPKIFVWLVLKKIFKKKETKWLTYQVVQGKENVKWIQEPCHIFNERCSPLTIIRKSSIVNEVSFLESLDETLWVKTEYTLFFFTFIIKLIHKK